MRKNIGFVGALLLLTVTAFAGCNSDEAKVVSDFSNVEQIKEARSSVWNEYVENATNDETRLSEKKDRAMDYGEVTMKYGLQVVGDRDENGYPLYIALHGGGSSDTPDVNDEQWLQMVSYYKRYLKNGVYVNPRGVRDTWDCHANPESYPLYDELIENMILFYDVDPNRVYILGFSAGGDGVYLVAPRMADRFAAANMSAGHPNGTSVVNLYNTPIMLQVGEFDSAYDRNKVTAEYDALLTDLNTLYEGGYEHKAYIHTGYGHNFTDNAPADQSVIADNAAWLSDGDNTSVLADTYAIHFLNNYTRNPLPHKVVWDLGNRGDQRSVESFYWVSAPYTTNDGILVISYDTDANTVTVESNTLNGDFEILLNEDMVDVFSPVTFITPDGTFTQSLSLSMDTLRETTLERGDSSYQFVVRIKYSELTGNNQ